MPRPHPPEFLHRAAEQARHREKPLAQITEDLGISDSGLRNLMRQADIHESRREGLTGAEHEERRALRIAKTGVGRKT